jgi:hypothetical protein
VFSSNTIAPVVSFAAALRGGAAQQQRPQQDNYLWQLHPQSWNQTLRLLGIKKYQVIQFGLKL